VPGGSHFLPKWAGNGLLSRTELIAGHYDWHIFGLLNGGSTKRTQRKARCLVSIRNPVQRFISYVMHKSHNISYWLDPNIELSEFKARLHSVEPEQMIYHHTDKGWLGNVPQGLLLDRVSLASVEQKYNVKYGNDNWRGNLTDNYEWRENQGPHNSLLRMLDPDFHDLNTAKRRLKQCLVVRLADDAEARQDSHRMFGAYLPWLDIEIWDWRQVRGLWNWQRQRVFFATFDQMHVDDQPFKSRANYDQMPDSHKEAIAEWMRKDMILYKQGLEQFQQQKQTINNAPPKPAVRWPALRWQLPTKRTTPIRDLAACSVGSFDDLLWLKAAEQTFAWSGRFPREPGQRYDHPIFGDCTQTRNSKFRPVKLLVERLWCAMEMFYSNEVRTSLEYLDEVVSLIGFGTSLGKCLDASVWPFGRMQILYNIRTFEKMFLNSNSITKRLSEKIKF